MMTHASTTLPWRRSFSVHVEMYSRGSNSRGRRSSFTTCWSRMARRRTSRPGKTFAGSAPVAYRRQAHDRAERHEDEREEPEAEREVPCNHDPRGVREGSGQVHQELVHHEQEDAEPREADPAPWASVAMRDRGRRVCGRVGDRFRNLRRLGGRDRDGLGLGEICGRVPSAGIAPPSFVLSDPTQRGAAGRACELRLAQRSERTAMVAVPPYGSSDTLILVADRSSLVATPRST